MNFKTQSEMSLMMLNLSKLMNWNISIQSCWKYSDFKVHHPLSAGFTWLKTQRLVIYTSKKTMLSSLIPMLATLTKINGRNLMNLSLRGLISPIHSVSHLQERKEARLHGSHFLVESECVPENHLLMPSKSLLLPTLLRISTSN